MRIGLTYDLQTDPGDLRQAEFDPPATIAALDEALQVLGHRVIRLGSAGQLLASSASLRGVDLVFNIAEGARGRCREAWVPMLLEQWGIPFVGSGSTTQALALDKVMSKRLAQALGVATPDFTVVAQPDECARAAELGFPLIVKPRYEGSGAGIDAGAVVRDAAALQQRVEWALARFAEPCLVEQFIPFGELTVFLIGNGAPQALPAIQRPLDPASRLSCHVAGPRAQAHWLSPVELTPELDATACRMASTVFEALRCRDMARVDFRVDDRGRLYFLEINPLPSFDPDGSVGLIAEYLGVTYSQMIGQILNAALLRLELPTASLDGTATPR
jgi:D-alanine-D-alanine ligase